MRPTFSIIAFTVLSGAGYGLWFLLGVGLAIAWPSCRLSGMGGAVDVPSCTFPAIVAAMLVAGFVFASVGLLASVAHLGQPQRAWRALSQWRSSWLSREGIAALLTFVPAVVIAAYLAHWWWLGGAATGRDTTIWLYPSAVLRPGGALLALGAAITVACTANIYASLKPVRAWNNRFVVRAYLWLALYSGGLLFAAFAAPSPAAADHVPALLVAVAILAAYCALLKRLYWRDIDRLPQADVGRATGLDALGTARTFEQPHTEENYLTHEMGFVLARKHARKLRAITLVCAFAIPGLLSLLALALPVLRVPATWFALVIGLAGVFVERWLFFAEARHTVMAYYGR